MRAALFAAGSMILSCLASSVRADEDLNVLTAANGAAPERMMDGYLKQLAFAALDRRDAEYEKLKTPERLAAWQQERRQFFLEQLGGFPESTPLRARVTGARAFDDYRIEKVVFESQPGFFVTGILYLPLTAGPHPAVLHPTGHSASAKARDLYQRASIVLVKSGLAVLCYDPVGQGERRQFLNSDGTPRFGAGTTSEHQLMGVGCILLGTSVARYMIWDGMRAIDYLQSRPDIDAQRIGCTGISGGGTQTSYLMALDDRIGAAAPGCYLTGFRRLLETIGPQDSEQNIHAQIRFGMDHGDYALMRAPRPTLIMAATRDYFDIQGAWRLFREAKRFYGRLEFAERVELIEPDTEHGFPTEMRVGAARWMRRWLMNHHEPVFEEDFPVLAEDELNCTTDGQVLRLSGARSLCDLSIEWEERLAEERARFWQTASKEAALARVRRVAGVRPFGSLPELKAENTGAVAREGYRIQKLLLRSEPGVALPALAFVPERHSADAFLYLHGDGKQAEAAPGGAIEQMVRAGHLVLAVDVRGIGETARQKSRARTFDSLVGPNWPDITLAYLLGKSFVGMRAEDTIVCARFLSQYPEGANHRVHLIAIGETTVPALHAAALEPDLFASTELLNGVSSWADVVRRPLMKNQLVNTVHGALRAYDLPDLVRTLPSGKAR